MALIPVEEKQREMYDCTGWVKVGHNVFTPRKTWYMRLLGTTLSLHKRCEQEIAMDYSVISCKVVNHLLPWCFTVKLSNGEKLRVSCDSRTEAMKWKEALRRASSQSFREQFELLEAIEETDGCTVFNALDIHDQSKVRVQRIDRDAFNASNDESAQALGQQLYAVRNLGHRNLLWASSVFHEIDYGYVVTRRVEGKKLSEVVAEHGGTLSEPMTRSIVRQVVDALSFMHRKGFVLRNITLDSIWCDASDPFDPKVTLTDFTHVAFVDDEEDLRMRNTVGDSKYHAPEMVEEESYNASVDMFALGVCVYRMLCGSFPFSSKMYSRFQMVKQLRQRLAFEEDAWTCISAEAKDFVKSLLKPCWLSRMKADDAEDDFWFDLRLEECGNSPAANTESSGQKEMERAREGQKSGGGGLENAARVHDVQACLEKNGGMLSPLVLRLLSPLSEETPPISAKSAVDTVASTPKERSNGVKKAGPPAS